MEAKMQALAEVIDHLVRHEVFRIGPVVITTTVVNTWMIMAVLFAVVFLLTRNLSDKPKGLLVDDESGILEALQILMRGEGYEVAVARNGREALEAIESAKPDIVVSDIRMPGVTGLEVLARARQVDPEIAVILMTAQASLQSAVRAVNEGAYYYLQKPFANDELLAILSRAAREPVRDPGAG